MILRRRADHRGAANIDILDDLGPLRAPHHRLKERVEIDHDEIDRADAVRGHRRCMLGIVADGEQAAMDHRVERLDPSVHHLWKAGEIGNVANHQPGFAEALPRAAGGDQLDAVARQRLAQLPEPRFVRHGQQGARDLHVRHLDPSTRSFQEARLSSQEMVMPSAGDSPVITSWRVACGRATPSIHKLSSAWSWPPRQRNCQTPPFSLSSAPWPSAVEVTSIAGARWNLTAKGIGPEWRRRRAANSRSSPLRCRPSLERLSRRSWIRP